MKLDEQYVHKKQEQPLRLRIFLDLCSDFMRTATDEQSRHLSRMMNYFFDKDILHKEENNNEISSC